MARNVLITLCYDGSGYHGWQVQQNAVSVQQVFQEALYKILSERPSLKGCSRTDTGVHAREFCISMQLESNIPCQRLQGALNHFLPPDMAVQDCREVPLDFHARYSCKGKEYVYSIWNHPVRSPFLRDRALHYWYPLDLEKLNRAASYFLGSHDFTSFCTIDSRERGDMTYRVAADGFLYNMVRILVGTMLRVAQGKFQADDMPKILAALDRNQAGPTAPACGLCLDQVFYDPADLG